MSSGAVDPPQRFQRLFRAEARCVRHHHLGEANDGVEGVAARGSCWRRTATCSRSPTGAAGSCPRSRGIGARSGSPAPIARRRSAGDEWSLGKFARLPAPDHKRADDLVCADQWHNEARSIAGLHRDLSQRSWRLVTYIGGLLRLFVLVAWRIASDAPRYWSSTAAISSSLKPKAARSRNSCCISSKT